MRHNEDSIMKFHVLIVVLLAGVVSGVLLAQPKLKLAVIPKGTTHIFWKSVEAGAQAAREAVGWAR